MWKMNTIYWLFQFTNLLTQIVAGPYCQELTPYQNETFIDKCARHIREAQNLIEVDINYHQPKLDFIQPCKNCRIKYIDIYFAMEEDVKIESINDGNAFNTIIPNRIDKYTVECLCTFNISTQAVADSLNKASKKHLNQTCNELVIKDPIKTFKVEDVEKCFEGRDKQAQANVTFKGEELVITSTMQYDYKKKTYKWLHKKLEADNPPKVTCESIPKGNEDVVKACQCLDKSKVFHSFPRLLADDLLSCHGDLKLLSMTDLRGRTEGFSCDGVYLKTLEEVPKNKE